MIQSLMVSRVKIHNIFSFPQNVQAVSEVHLAFQSMGTTGSFLGDEVARIWSQPTPFKES